MLIYHVIVLEINKVILYIVSFFIEETSLLTWAFDSSIQHNHATHVGRKRFQNIYIFFQKYVYHFNKPGLNRIKYSFYD